MRIDVAPDGSLAAVEPGSPRDGATLLDGPVVPGMPNAHSHVAQRALAGRTEGAGPAGDSFWSWRSTMYAFVGALEPAAFEAIAADAFAAMLEAGYTSVAEFHYLHHAPDGSPYADPAEMSERVVAAARAAGIGLTVLPVLYRYAGAGGVAPLARQRRFITEPAAFAQMWAQLAARYRAASDVRLGAAFHSLRAVEPADIAATLDALERAAPGAPPPLHVHLAEQSGEVDEVRAAYGAPPLEVLARTVALGPRWSLIHATQSSPADARRIAAADATVVLCPTTEANLGDGIFPLAAFREAGGCVAIGSDSNVTLDVAEELRWLEYAQRLAERRRHVFGSAGAATLGEALYRAALRGGARALALPVGALAPGLRADLVVLRTLDDADDTAPPSLDAYVFASGRDRVREVMCGGRFVVRDGAHSERAALRARALQAARATRAAIASTTAGSSGNDGSV